MKPARPKSTFRLIQEQANHTTHQDGRQLTCTSCQENIRVYELPQPWLDPREFLCGLCLCLPPFTSGKPRLSVLGDAA